MTVPTQAYTKLSTFWHISDNCSQSAHILRYSLWQFKKRPWNLMSKVVLAIVFDLGIRQRKFLAPNDTLHWITVYCLYLFLYINLNFIKSRVLFQRKQNQKYYARNENYEKRDMENEYSYTYERSPIIIHVNSNTLVTGVKFNKPTVVSVFFYTGPLTRQHRILVCDRDYGAELHEYFKF